MYNIVTHTRTHRHTHRVWEKTLLTAARHDRCVCRVVLVSAFVTVTTVWSVTCLLFFCSRCLPRSQPFLKVGGGRRGHEPPMTYGVGSTAVFNHKHDGKISAAGRTPQIFFEGSGPLFCRAP